MINNSTKRNIAAELVNGFAVHEREWAAMNARRNFLIDKDIDAELDPCERRELDDLERSAEEYVNRMAPQPVEMIRKLEAAAIKDGLLIPSDDL